MTARIGPMNPDANERFNQINANVSAKDAIRNHAAAYAPATLRALTAKRNEHRSADGAIDLQEVTDFLKFGENGLGDNAEITGVAIRGDDGSRQWLTFTWRVPTDADGSGRTAKGAVELSEENFPKTFALGERAVEVHRADSSGAPLWVRDLVLALKGDPVDSRSVDGESDQVAKLKAKIAELEAANAQSFAGAPTPTPTPAPTPTPTPTPSEQDVQVPWEGYESLKAPEIIERLKSEASSPAEAWAVFKYEGAQTSPRAGVRKIAEEKKGNTPDPDLGPGA